MCPDDKHPHMIDLGLPSRTMWACCNVGSPTPEQAGGYYAWGETNTKATYGVNNYRYPGHIGDIAGTEYDVAHTQWGDSWRMPTSEQMYELLCNTNKKWSTYNGVEGYKFTGRNGNSIFIPAAGYCSNRLGCEENVYLWSSNRDDLDDDAGMLKYSKCLIMNKNHTEVDAQILEEGLNVRPVSK